MAISFPQVKVANNASAGSSLAATFTSPIAAGSIIVGIALTDTGITSYSIVDDKSDAVTKDTILGVVTDSTIGTKAQIFAFLSPTTGAQTVTVTPNVGFTFCEVVIWEIAGLTGAVFDKVVTAISTTSLTADSGPTGTLSSSNEAAIGYGISNGNFTAAGSGWTLDQITSFADLVEHQVLSSNASIDATGTTSSVQNRMWCATFMSGSAPASTPPQGIIVYP